MRQGDPQEWDAFRTLVEASTWKALSDVKYAAHISSGRECTALVAVSGCDKSHVPENQRKI